MEEAGFFLSFYSLAAFGNIRRKITFQLYRCSDYTGCSFLVTGNYYEIGSDIAVIQLTVEHLKSTAELTQKAVDKQQVALATSCYEILKCKT
jgi:hypothetical protein